MQQGEVLGCPLRFDDAPREALSPSPTLGADNERLL
jgi:crotonobetainyl-CoA:carnitine CoA-transferase CaiB-like acyl-CoA transferase